MAALGLTLSVGTASANNTTHSLFGIDVSQYQGSVNWASVKAGGPCSFAYARCDIGSYYHVDPDFQSNMANGKNAGLYMGAYHVTHSGANTPAEECNYFWHNQDGYVSTRLSIMPAADFEVFDGVDGASTYTAWLNDWSSDVIAKGTSAGITLRPIIYASAGSGMCDLNTGITMGAWVASYNGGNLYTGNPWQACCTSCNQWDIGGQGNWTFWQVSSTGSISGVSGSVDFDAFNGTLADLVSWQGVVKN